MKLDLLQTVDSVSIYQSFWMCWHVLGISTNQNRYLCGFYDVFLNVFVTICYPLHLTIGLFMESTQANVFKNLSINITCVACSIKHYFFRYTLKDVRAVQELFAQLDKRATDDKERAYFNSEPKVGARNVLNLFYVSYLCANLAAVLSALLSSERRLMYPAWFPFDWQASAVFYWLALVYQYVGVSIQIIQNMAYDIYAPMSLCILGGHVRLLSMRIAKIGHDRSKTQQVNDQELIACIEDHKKLINIFNLLQRTISYAQLTQFIASGSVMCIVLVYLLYYVDNVFALISSVVYFIAMTIGLFPCCYYGSVLQQEFEDLSYAIFKSNWLKQSRGHRQHLIILTQLTLKRITPVAGGIIGIHLGAFFATCKMAYSLYAVIMRVK